MCGILGYIAINKEQIQTQKEQFLKSLNILSHRGPDFSNSIQYKNMLLGHTRLSIIDLESRSNQPMYHKDKYILVFNGEIYNYRELKEELYLQGYRFSTQGDAEVLLCAYDFWGEKCVERFNGMWAFALLDIKKDKLFCSRDRFGEKPFYYYWDEQCFIFASEIKAILPFLDKRVANIPAIIPFIVRGNVDCYKNETFFKRIFRVNPSENLVMNLNNFKVQKYTYYMINTKEVDNKNPVLYVRRILEDSVRLRLRSDVQIGSCLSGGLDSSIINALIARLHPNKKDGFIAIHAKSSLRESDESAWAKEVAKFLGIELCIVEPAKESFLESLEKVMLIQDEPFGSTSIYMQHFVMQKANELGIKVMFDGQGADEIFLGYESYLGLMYYLSMKKESFFKNIKMFCATKKWVLDESEKLSDFDRDFFRIKWKGGINEKFLNKNDLFCIFAYKGLGGAHYSQEDIMFRRLQALLRYEDRNSMAFGVESRLPYLDARLVDFVVSLPIEVKFRKGYLKYLLRESCKDILPENIIWRYNKMGFESPQKLWIDGIRNSMLESIYQSKLLRKIFHTINIREDNFMWRLYNIARWEELYKVEI